MKTLVKNYLQPLSMAVLGGTITLLGYTWITASSAHPGNRIYTESSANARLVSDGGPGVNLPDLTTAAALATPAVVHVKSNYIVQTRNNMMFGNPFQDFFQDDWMFGRPQQRNMESSGSGVITNPEGYIVTNNHVIQGAEKVEVVLQDGQTFMAEVVGTDPSTDIALLKVDAKGLPYVSFGTSDALKVGEWVLAVGNPFNLTSTVTAGIVSAKARNINILKDRMAIESFIQTDAAVNPGNSGGALVNARGELVGINTAIASTTGAYAGYSFAVPVEIVKKVIQDLMDHGVVQRAFLGAEMTELNGDVAKKLGTDRTHGVYINSVLAGGSAEASGIQKGDIIVELDGKEIHNAAELSEYIGRHSPGDEISAKVARSGKVLPLTIRLLNSRGNTDAVRKQDSQAMSALGVDLQPLDPEELSRLNLRAGVRVSQVHDGKIRQYTDIRPGFIITTLDHQAVKSVEDVSRILNNKQGGVMIEGIYPDRPGLYYYAFGL
jgi:Do/DeqQ family serine protease